MSNLQDTVNKLLAKAISSHDSADALRFSQAALNAAHTNHALAKIVEPKD